jgi:pimeloyl-ACP methyl ester carboxylesterase
MVLTIKNGEFEMDYFKFGNGKKNMIIIPGVSIKSVMESEEIIKNAYKLFSNDFTIYVFDRKKKMEKSYNIFNMADDLIKAIDGLGLKDLYALGASQGGMIALIIAFKRGDLIKKLNVNSTTAFVAHDKYLLFDELINLSINNKLLDMVKLFCKKAYSNELYESVKDSLLPFVNSINENDINNFIIESEALKDFNILNDLDKIKCDTFIIASKLDQIFDYNDSITLNNKIKNSKLFLYDKYGHDVYDEALDIKNRIYDFYME